ncbi:MAG: STAS domain-containing protein [Actinobacteria bacterium]|nr:STAS domain-containing protein [Actinomycetota bacterium]
MSGPDVPLRRRPLPQHLDSQVSYRLGVPLIYLKGELDHDSANYARELIKEETAGNPAALVLDLSELSYMDSGGLSLMFELVSQFKDRGWLGVVAPRAGVLRLLEITGLSERQGFRIFPDVQSASMALSSPGSGK